jgi:pentatricopeptide repeat protein
MIAGYAQNGLVHEAQNLFKEMPERNVVSWNAMIGGFAHNGFVVEALQHFQEMSKPNVVSWTLMIAAYTRHGHPQEALSMFRQMQKSSVQPNQFTYSSVLSACADLASLNRAWKSMKRL